MRNDLNTEARRCIPNKSNTWNCTVPDNRPAHNTFMQPIKPHKDTAVQQSTHTTPNGRICAAAIAARTMPAWRTCPVRGGRRKERLCGRQRFGHTAEIGARPLTGEERAVGVIDRPAAPELARRRVLVAQELPVEVGEVIESADVTNRRNRLVRFQQIATSAADASGWLVSSLTIKGPTSRGWPFCSCSYEYFFVRMGD